MSVYYNNDQINSDVIAGIDYNDLVAELRDRPHAEDLVSMQDVLQLFNGEIANDDPRIDALLARLATDGFALDEPSDADEVQLHKNEASIRDNVHIYMRDLSRLDLLSRDEELALARARHQGLNEVLSALATIQPVVESAHEQFAACLKSGRLDRFVAGYLDVVDELPKVNVVAHNEPRDTKGTPPNVEKAQARFERFSKALDDYFAKPKNRRTIRARRQLEDAFGFIKFTMPRYGEFVNEFEKSIAPLIRARAKIRRIVTRAGG